MATYKVPQDVEVADKLIGPLSLKQFIFVIIMVCSLWLAWTLAKINILLGILPLPVAIVSGVLGLYQRKDQPVEVFLASWVRYKTKPRKRIWDQEGFEERVIITVPRKILRDYTKGMNADQVTSRLGQLSALMDSRGWASKYAVNNPAPAQTETTSMNRHFHESERLFTARELTQFAPAPALLDEATSVDPYENDPRNRTAQIVASDMKQQERAAKNHALAVVEQARAEHPIETSEESAPLDQKQPSPKPAVAPSTPQQDENEATIEINHH